MSVDAGLVQRAQQGDEQAFATIVEVISNRFLSVAQRILHDAQLAEDATQQVFVKLWRHLPGLKDPTRFEAWSYRLLVKACYTEHGRRRRWKAESSLQPTDAPPGPDAYRGVIERDELDRALRRVSVDHRAVLVLHYYLDLPQDEVAEALGVPVGTVYSRLHRAHQALRGVLEADARTPEAPLPTEVAR